MDDESRKSLVSHSQGRGFAVLDSEVVGRGIHFEPGCCFGFNRIVAAGLQRDMNPAVAVSGHGVHQATVHFPNFKCYVGKAFALVAFADLDQFQASNGGVIEPESLSIAHLDLNGFGAGIKDVAIQAANLLGDNRHARFQSLNHDPAILVCGVLAIGTAQHLSIGLGDKEGYTF